jgi:N-succinyldiaminopimelate aminotransferase
MNRPYAPSTQYCASCFVCNEMLSCYAMPMTRPFTSQRVANFGETVFTKYTRLAQHHKAINLGQGFPDFAPPDFVLQALRNATETYQQYAPLPGMPQLTGILTDIYSRRLGQDLEAVRNVQITVGATEALYAAMQALIDPGDEVILFEPFYDAYPADVMMAGGIPKYVPLHPENNAWHLDLNELQKACSSKTKLIVLNTPSNPCGKVFNQQELDAIINVATEFNMVIISDEVYEHIAFAPHVSIASRPGGFERTLTISSVGKTFSVTGWKIGWAVGPERLIHALRMAHQWIPFAVATPLQLATAECLKAAQTTTYYQELQKMYFNKLSILLTGLQDSPFKAMTPEGSYFIIADSSSFGYKDDVECDHLPQHIGVAAIPPSAFYSPQHTYLAKHLVRFAFCKTDQALIEGAKRLKGL